MRTTWEFVHHYLRLGMAVLPLHHPIPHDGRFRCSCGQGDCASPAKHPFAKLVATGVRAASKEPSVVDRWFRETHLNVGIATGAPSGILVLDIDPRHGGDETLQALEQQYGTLPPTWRFLTGGGGEHIVFRHPGGRVLNSAGRLGRGIDVRGDGGYIVAPPSQHLSGRAYAISVDHHPDDVDLAAVPTWLMALLDQRSRNGKAAPRPTEEWRGIVSGNVPEGERNQTLASVAGYLLRNRIDPWVAIELLQAWNRSRCNPPLADDEVVRTVRSIALREIERREGRDAG